MPMVNLPPFHLDLKICSNGDGAVSLKSPLRRVLYCNVEFCTLNTVLVFLNPCFLPFFPSPAQASFYLVSQNCKNCSSSI